MPTSLVGCGVGGGTCEGTLYPILAKTRVKHVVSQPIYAALKMTTGQEILQLKLMSYKNKGKTYVRAYSNKWIAPTPEEAAQGRRDVLFRLSKSRWA